MVDKLSAIRGMMGGNPEAFAMQLMRQNPQFASFVQANQGKTPQQIASENGVDWSAVTKFMGK